MIKFAFMKTISFWLKFSILNLFLVSFLGVLMRYKIAFSFPILDQKHAQEAHSHFAFYGWVTTVIYAFLLQYLLKNDPQIKSSKYYYLIIANVFSAFGMMFSFLYGGYFWLSILFSTTALLGTFVFLYFFYKDSLSIKDTTKKWFLGGLFFAFISSIGVFNLAYMNATHSVSQVQYLASLYYYLHFQYNGFFIFCCIGFLLFSLKEIDVQFSRSTNDLVFWLSFIGCVIGYGLSVLYLDLPEFLFIVIILGSIAQTIAAYFLLNLVLKNWRSLKINWTPLQRSIIIFAGFSFLAKILLQLFSNIPALNQFAFGYRNVVIAYLHLVLLLCISSFLVGQIYYSGYFKFNKKVVLSIKIFLLGIFLNELVLGLMGIFSTRYISIPYAAEILVAVSVLIMFSLAMMWIDLKEDPKNCK